MFNRNNNNGHSEPEESQTRWRSATVLDDRGAEEPAQAPAAAAQPQHASPEPQSSAEAFQRPVDPPTVPAPAASTPTVAAPPTPAPAGEVFIMVRRTPEGRIEVYECASELEMENLIGELVSRGEDQMNISAYQAAKIDFEIQLQPRVRLMRG
jgi:hypothetical protein